MEINISRKTIFVFVIAALVIALGIGGYFAWITWGADLLTSSQPTEELTAEADPLTDLAIRYVKLAYTFDYQNPDQMLANCQEAEDMGGPCAEDIVQMLINYEQVQSVVVDSTESSETVIQVTTYPTRIVHITTTVSSKDIPERSIQAIVTIIFDPASSKIVNADKKDVNP